MTQRAGHGWWPYLVPLLSFLGLGEISARLPEAWQAAFLPLKVALPGLLFALFWRRGAYPELRVPLGGFGAGLADLGVGIAGGLLWMAPFVLLLWSGAPPWEVLPELLQPDPAEAFDPEQLGAGAAWLALGLRALGYGVVTPFVEELFVRSWLDRYAQVFDAPRDFRDVPIGQYTRRSFLVVLLFFTGSHLPWEWPVAGLWLVLTQLWFYRRRRMAALVLVHAGSNLTIFACALAAAGSSTPLWFFL